MPADAHRSPPSPRSPFHRPEGQPPVLRTPSGRAMELRMPDKDSNVVYVRVGGLVRVRGTAVIRHASGNVEQAIEIVMAEEDASTVAARILGETGRFRGSDEVG